MTFNSDATFWSRKSPLSAESERLHALLVPPEGKCETLEGELIRASSRIYYDYYNNGFGNNWSGAFKFLDEHLGLKRTERNLLKSYARGRMVSRNRFNTDDRIPVALEEICGRVVQKILDMEKNKIAFTPNPGDMFDLQERNQRY